MKITDLRFPESDISVLADRYVRDLRPEDKLPEAEAEAFRVVVRSAGFVTKDQLRKLAKWKSSRSAGWVGVSAILCKRVMV